MEKRFLIIMLPAVSILMSACDTIRPLTYRQSSDINVECTQLAGNGDCIVSVQETGHNIEAATEAAKQGAVYQLLFNGVKGSTDNRIQNIPALVKDTNAQKEKSSYFNSFFKDGTYRDYVENIPESVPDVKRINGGYKVTILVILKKESLRKKLESDNIIKSLSKVIEH